MSRCPRPRPKSNVHWVGGRRDREGRSASQSRRITSHSPRFLLENLSPNLPKPLYPNDIPTSSTLVQALSETRRLQNRWRTRGLPDHLRPHNSASASALAWTVSIGISVTARVKLKWKHRQAPSLRQTNVNRFEWGKTLEILNLDIDETSSFSRLNNPTLRFGQN